MFRAFDIFRSSLVHLVCSRYISMCSMKKSYEEAVHKLNLLQSNKATIDQIRRDIKTHRKCTNLEDMEYYLSRIGVPLKKLDELSVIHVTGTKGKGSTSAMCESILRHHGFRTGFFSSPHLVVVRERIQLDGRVITEDTFAQYFHQVYDMLDASQKYRGDMPKYFAFLTVLAYNIFLKENVDVAIIEVGIGGVVDYTNVIRKTPVVGITALGLDHTSILGNTLPEIAAAKAGIMKPGCQAYTVKQPPEAMEVLKNFANNFKCALNIVPDYKSYIFPDNLTSHLPVDVEAYEMNASLAVQLAHAWMRIAQKHGKNGFQNQVINGHNGININGINKSIVRMVSNKTLEGLRACRWPGRYHVLQSDYARFFLDGAHTKESMEICVQWFRNSSGLHDKTLIFSATGERNTRNLLQPLLSLDFKQVYFVVPTAYKEVTQTNDNYSKVEQDELITRCKMHLEYWQQMDKEPKPKLTVLECVSEALFAIKKNNADVMPSVLITGSLYLVGAALSILDPNLST